MNVYFTTRKDSVAVVIERSCVKTNGMNPPKKP